MVERSALTKQLGKPSEEVLKDFIKSVPKVDGKPGDSNAATSVWRSSGLASWDKHVEGKLSEHTERSLHRRSVPACAQSRSRPPEPPAALSSAAGTLPGPPGCGTDSGPPNATPAPHDSPPGASDWT
jgi:hypothetical protein